MAQRFDEQVNLQFSDPGTGAASGLMNLSRQFQGFRDKAFEVHKRQVIEEQTAEGQAAFVEGEKPEFKKEGFIGGVSARAFNAGLKSSYTASLKRDALTAINDIELDAGADLDKFNKNMEAHIKSVMENVDPYVYEEVDDFIKDQATSARLSVQTAQHKQIRDEAVATTQKALGDIADIAYKQARAGNTRASAVSLQNYFAEVDRAAEAGYVTPAQVEPMKRAAELRATQANIMGTITGQIKAGNTTDALKMVEAIVTQPVQGMTLEEKSALADSVISDVNQLLTLNNKMEADQDEAAKENQESTSMNLYVGVLKGEIDASDIINQASLGNIDQSQTSTLMNIVNNQGGGFDDWGLITQINTMINENESPTAINKVIANATGKNLTPATAAELMQSAITASEKDSPVASESYKSALKFLEGMVAVRGVMGTLDTESERRLAVMNREMRERTLAGENPWAVADELIPRDAINKKAGQLRYGTIDDLPAAQAALDADLTAGNIDDDTYNYQYNIIQQLRQMTANMKGFEQEKKDSMNVQ